MIVLVTVNVVLVKLVIIAVFPFGTTCVLVDLLGILTFAAVAVIPSK